LGKAIIQCLKCGDFIESKYRHDFVWCSCKNIYIDGGDDYCRYGGKGLEDKTFKIIVKENKYD